MDSLLLIRKAVVDLTERARSDKCANLLYPSLANNNAERRKLRNSLEIDVTLVIPNDVEDSKLVTLLYSQGKIQVRV